MGKYVGKVPWPTKTVKIANQSSKLTPRQSLFAKKMVRCTSKALNVKNKGLYK